MTDRGTLAPTEHHPHTRFGLWLLALTLAPVCARLSVLKPILWWVVLAPLCLPALPWSEEGK